MVSESTALLKKISLNLQLIIQRPLKRINYTNEKNILVLHFFMCLDYC